VLFLCSWDRASWYISIAKPTRIAIFWVYWISLYMFRTVFPNIIRSPRLYTQRQVYVIQVSWLLASAPVIKQSTNMYDIHLTLCVQSWTPDDGRKDRPKHVEWFLISKFRRVLYVFFWVIPWRLNFIFRHFGTLCSIFIGK